MPTTLLGETLPAIFHHRIQHSGDRPAIYSKQGGVFSPISWSQLAQDVTILAAGLVRSGVQPGDRVIQFSENRYEWVVVDFAIQLAQAVHVPVHAPLTGSQAAFQIADSGAKVAFVSTAQQAEKLSQAADMTAEPASDSASSKEPSFVAETRDWHSGLQVFTFDSSPAAIGNAIVRSWRDLMTAISVAEASALARRAVEAVKPEALATILYTSGTTGEPKGVMLTQHNIVSNARAATEGFEMSASDRRLTFLPLSHIFARTCDLYTWLEAGYELGLAESRESVIADCALFRPTLLNGVPYFYDKVRRAIIDQGSQDPEALRKLLGGDIRLCCSGGAALPDHVFDFFWEHGVPLLQGYGLTETSPVISMSSPDHVRRGASGRTIRDVEVRIADDGEILSRGPHIMVGYYHKPDATAEVIRDGWFHTGDLGRVDEDGFVYITGRKKEILVTSGGKNIAPVYLESLLTEDPLILQAVVFGDGRDYLSALIVPNAAVLQQELTSRGKQMPSGADVLTHPDVLALYEEHIRDRLRNVSYYEQIRKFRLMNRGFTIESGELTPKLSLRRKIIEANCREQIESMYTKG
jgi:long-chain acyl-CoA synthetase